MNEDELEMDMEDLVSAEDFLEYFGVTFDASVVHVNRLHILQRFHNYVSKSDVSSMDEDARREHYKAQLEKAYADFVTSDALTEKVFKVFHMNEPQTTVIPLDQIFK